jgi:hypothetical protein
MSKKVYVTMSPEDYAALQQSIANRKKQETAKASKQQHGQQQPKAGQSGGLDGFTVFLMFVVSLIFGYWGLS